MVNAAWPSVKPRLAKRELMSGEACRALASARVASALAGVSDLNLDKRLVI